MRLACKADLSLQPLDKRRFRIVASALAVAAKPVFKPVERASMRQVGLLAAGDRNNSRGARTIQDDVARTGSTSAEYRTSAAASVNVDKFVARASVRPANGQSGPGYSVADMKARQTAKMREIREALIAEGCVHLDDQAAALGLPRSTTWTIIKGNHKASGLSATVLARMLSAPRLQPRVRAKILEYIEAKRDGHFGGGKNQLQKFIGRLNGAENRMDVCGND